jgi:lysophospholipase L1-like esterase
MTRFPFQFPRRRKSSSFSSYSSKSRSRKKTIPLPFLVASVPLAILAAELLLRLGVGATGKAGELAGYFGESPVVSDYRLQVNTASGQGVSGAPWGELKVRSSPLTGYELLPNQKTRTAEINKQGFRASQAIPTTKPAGEVRVLLVGGSVAFGTMSPDNGATIASLLETQLNQQVTDQKANAKNFRPDVLPYFADEMEKALRLPSKIREGQYRVINAAVPGYLASNVLSQLSNQLLDYQPDVVVLIDGYGDLMAPSDRTAATLSSIEDPLLSNATGHFFGSLGSSFNGLVNQFYLVKALNAWILKPNPKSELLADVSNLSGSLTDRLSSDSTEIQKRVDRRTRALDGIAKLTNSRKIPLIVGLQPEISQVKTASDNDDTKILKSLDSRYPKLIQDQYTKLVQAQKTVNGITSLSFQEAIDTTTKAKGAPNLFQDAIHPKTRLNQTIATTLQTTIGPQLQVQPKPFTGGNP